MKKIISYYIFLLRLILNKDNFISKVQSQNNGLETIFLNNIIKKIKNKSFIEFGFHPFEFNTINLMTSGYEGTLVDANHKNVFLMKILSFFHNYKIKVHNIFLKKENINNILNKNFGIFSIDVDGNDYWLTREVLGSNSNFEVIIVEYNSSFLDKSITVPYDSSFNRHQKHISGWYHGASLKAFVKLLNKNNYVLVKTTGGNNAFFVKKESLKIFNLKELSYEQAFEESVLRNLWSKKNAQEQFDTIKHMEFVEV